MLVFLQAWAGATAGDIAQHLGVSPSTVTGLVDRLVQIYLVRRTCRTEGGAQVVAGLDEVGRERLTTMLRTMDGPRLQQLRKAPEGLVQAPGAEPILPMMGSLRASW